MIRMGRNSRTEEPNTPNYPNQTSNLESMYQYQTEHNAASTKPVTDSESMARDIKDGRLSGFVGHGTTLKGEANFQMMLRVDGHLIGTVSSDGGTLIVGTQGQVDANISVATAQVNGTVNGDILATEKIILGRTAKVVGNIMAPRLVIEDGAILEGGCSMLNAREAHETRQAEVQAAKYSTTTQSSYSTTAVQELDEDDDDEILTEAEDEDEEEVVL